MSQVQTRTVRKKAGSVSLSAEFFTFALHARLRAQHPPTADKSVRSRIRLESALRSHSRQPSDEVLRILLSISGAEIHHFSLWHDKASAVSSPLATLTDPTGPHLSIAEEEIKQSTETH